MVICGRREAAAFLCTFRTEVRMSSADVKNEKYIEEVKRIVKEIKYGSITLIVQDGKVIQIDKTEKIRMDK